MAKMNINKNIDECNRNCFYYDFYISALEEYEQLIIVAAKDIAHLTREVVGLRYLLLDKYPELRKDMYKGLENHIDYNDLYTQIVDKYGRDPLNNKRYYNDLYKLSNSGKSWMSIYPFSIKK